MAYNLSYPQVQPSNVTPQERMFDRQIQMQNQEKKQIMAKIQQYKALPNKFAPEELQFLQLKAMELGIPFSTDRKTTGLHKVSVAGGEFLDNLLLDLIPDSMKESIFGRAMNQTERNWSNTAGTIGFMGSFVGTGGIAMPGRLALRALRPTMIATLAKNPRVLRSLKSSMKAMGFRNVATLKAASRFKPKGVKGAAMSKNAVKVSADDLVKQAGGVSDKASRGAQSAKSKMVNMKNVQDIVNKEGIWQNASFRNAIQGARNGKEAEKLAFEWMKANGYAGNFQASSAIKKYFGGSFDQFYTPQNIANRMRNQLGGRTDIGMVSSNMIRPRPRGYNPNQLPPGSGNILGQGLPRPQLQQGSGMNIASWRGF